MSTPCAASCGPQPGMVSSASPAVSARLPARKRPKTAPGSDCRRGWREVMPSRGRPQRQHQSQRPCRLSREGRTQSSAGTRQRPVATAQQVAVDQSSASEKLDHTRAGSPLRNPDGSGGLERGTNRHRSGAEAHRLGARPGTHLSGTGLRPCQSPTTDPLCRSGGLRAPTASTATPGATRSGPHTDSPQ